MTDFKSFDFDNNEKWNSYVNRLEPVPTGNVLEKRKQKWFKQHIDPDFVVNVQVTEPTPAAHAAPAKDSKTVPEPTPNPVGTVEEDWYFGSANMVGSAFALLAMIPYVNGLAIPMPIAGSISCQALSAIMFLAGFARRIYMKMGFEFTQHYLQTVTQSVEGQSFLLSVSALSSGLWMLLLPPLLSAWSFEMETEKMKQSVLQNVGSIPTQYHSHIPQLLAEAPNALRKTQGRVEVGVLVLMYVSFVLGFFVSMLSGIPLSSIILFSGILRTRYVISTYTQRAFSEFHSICLNYAPDVIRMYYIQFADLLFKYAIETLY